MNNIKLQSGDWLWNASILGFMNIVGKENVDIDRSDNTISFSEDLLDGFEEKFFDYFIDSYKVMLPWYKIISFESTIRYIRKNDYENFTYRELQTLNDYIVDVAKRYIKSDSFVSAAELIGRSEYIVGLGKSLQKIKEPKESEFENEKVKLIQEVEKQLEIIERIIDYCSDKTAKKYIAAKNVIYSVINNGWDRVSFLFQQTKIKDVYEDYKKVFVEPARQYINADKVKYKLECFVCGMPVKDANTTMSFLNNVGFDTSRKLSHVWDFQNDTFICPLCRLVYSCLPAGITYFRKTGIYLNAGMDLNYNYRVNNDIKGDIYDDVNNSINKSGVYKALIKTMNSNKVERTEYEIVDIQVVRYENKTYKFNFIPRDISLYIKSNSEDIDKLNNTWYKDGNDWYSIYNEVVDRIFNNQNFFSLIYKLLHFKISSPNNCSFNAFHVFKVIELNAKLLRKFLGGNIKMEQTSNGKSIAEQAKASGYYLREAYSQRDSNIKKLSGINYRLLNALKTNNRNAFMDVLLNCYLYVGKEVPKIFVEAFEDDKVFQTIGYAFVSGVIDDKEKENKKEEDK